MEQKKWYQSLTVWGVAIAGLSVLVLPLIGQPELAQTVESEKANIMDILTKAGEVIGLALALYGRLRASTKITS